MQAGWLAPVSIFVILAAYPGELSRPQTSNAGLLLAQQSEGALSGSVVIGDISLSGTGVRTSGADSETGNFKLQASTGGLSRFDFAASAGTRSEIFNLSSTNRPQGWWMGTDGVSHPMAYHNSLAGSVWFFPALSILSAASGSNAVVAYIGAEMKGAVSVQHIRVSAQNSTITETENAMLQQFSATDFYIDPSTFLPLSMVYQIHPDNDQNKDIAVDVEYSDYRSVQGAIIPYRIRKYINGSLCWDLTVNSTAMNTGLAGTVFSAN